MSRYFAFQLRSWAYPVFVITLAAAVWCAVPHSKDIPPSPTLDQLATHTERSLEQKAVRVLEGLGESAPVVVVTVTTSNSKKIVQTFRPTPEGNVVESKQRTFETLDRSKKKDDSGYHNEKEAVNYMVGQTKTLETVEGPHLKRQTCLAEVSSKNAGRVTEIEAALTIALGFNTDRGDRMLVVVKP